MDKPFAECIKEIESNYVSFPKASRIRIEKWVEKLVISSDANPKWRRHRDLYARYLLSMVISKRLDEPFSQLPPDGPLPSFPVEKIYKCKDLLGPRESLFWRQMYNTLTTTQSMKRSAVEQELGIARRSSLMPMPGQDVHNLNLIIKEQANRIQLLEEKLHDERVRHEMQIRQLMSKYENQYSASLLPPQQQAPQTEYFPINGNPPRSAPEYTRPSGDYSQMTSHHNTTTRSTVKGVNNNETNTSLSKESLLSNRRANSADSNHHRPITPNPVVRPQRTTLLGRPKLSDINSGYTSTVGSEVSDDGISNRLKGHKKEVWIDYMQYLDKFQDEIESLRS